MDLGVAAWCDLVILAVAHHEDTTCLMTDPIAVDPAFAELIAWCPHPGPGRPEVRRAVHHPGDLVPAAPPWTCQMGARRAIERDHGAVEVGLGSPVRHRRATAAARHRHGFMR
jgi:hypothetical protein